MSFTSLVFGWPPIRCRIIRRWRGVSVFVIFVGVARLSYVRPFVVISDCSRPHPCRRSCCRCSSVSDMVIGVAGVAGARWGWGVFVRSWWYSPAHCWWDRRRHCHRRRCCCSSSRGRVVGRFTVGWDVHIAVLLLLLPLFVYRVVGTSITVN